MTGEAAEKLEDIDIDSTMRETLNEINESEKPEEETHDSKDDTTASEESGEEQSDGDGEEAKEAERESGEKQLRDEKGRFKSKDGEDKPVEQDTELDQQSDQVNQQEQQQKQEEDPNQQQQQQSQQIDDDRAPSTWRTEAKLLWKDLPDTVRAEILKREQDVGRGIAQYREAAQVGSEVMNLVNPYMPLIREAGSTPQKTIGVLLDTLYKLKTADPVTKSHLLLQTAQQYGADMNVFKQDIDPAMQQNANMNQVLAPVMNEINGIKQQLNQRDETAAQQVSEQYNSEIQTFRNETDDQGNLKHPHFDIVAAKMADLIDYEESIGNRLSLQDAYDNACWSDPAIRDNMLSQQRANQEKQKQDEAKRKAEEAKKADNVNLQQKGTYDSEKPKPTGTVEDTLKETMAAINNRQS
jgi:hypothetical protein